MNYTGASRKNTIQFWAPGNVWHTEFSESLWLILKISVNITHDSRYNKINCNTVVNRRLYPNVFIWISLLFVFQFEISNNTIYSHGGCWNYLLQPVEGMNLIVILIEDLNCNDRKRKDLKKRHSCVCPQVIFFIHN